jgi:3-phenylpropionate/cinnamic acid dioxygenase small subunit
MVTLEERSAAVDLQCRWADAVDRRDWDAVAACYTADASFELPRTGGHGDRSAMLLAVRSVIERLDVTQHHLSNHLVDRTTDGLVARCSVLAQHVRSALSPDSVYTFGGRYTDVLVDSADGLLICNRRLEVVWSTGNPAVLT